VVGVAFFHVDFRSSVLYRNRSVCSDRFPCRGELPVMHERAALIVKPQSFGVINWQFPAKNAAEPAFYIPPLAPAARTWYRVPYCRRLGGRPACHVETSFLQLRFNSFEGFLERGSCFVSCHFPYRAALDPGQPCLLRAFHGNQIEALAVARNTKVQVKRRLKVMTCVHLLTE